MPDPTLLSGSDAEWEDLMRQLRQQARPQPRPFLYARIQARLAASGRAERFWLPGWVRRPAYVALLGALGLMVSRDSAALRPAALASRSGSYQPSQLLSLPPR